MTRRREPACAPSSGSASSRQGVCLCSALDLTVSEVRINAAVDITPPTEAKSAAIPPATVKSQQVAEGVFWLTGGLDDERRGVMRTWDRRVLRR